MSRKHYAPRTPRPALGFRAQDLRNVPRAAWWAKRWFAAIEAMRLGGRGGRGRQYAELGQVTELVLDGGHVEAVVAGGREDPYAVRIDFAPAADVPVPDAMAAGRALAGELPVSLGGAGLWPKLGRDTFWCSCPDWSKPCKHIAAVLYLLGDAMTRDPGLLLRLRGVPVGDDDAPPPLWRGVRKFEDALERIYRRVGVLN